MKRHMIIILILVFLLSGNACAQTERVFLAMDTVMTLRAQNVSEEIMDACVNRIMELERLLSATDEDSEIGRLNREGTVTLSADTGRLLAFAREMGERTGGALDITMYPVVRAWGFTAGEYRVPDEEELKALLELTGFRKVVLTETGEARLPKGMMVDLGSVAKGYASDELAELLRGAGETSALIDLGGNLYCLGANPEGSDWRVGIRDPRGEGFCGTLNVRDCAVVTSGAYERFFDAPDGKRYGHIFDPSAGRPAESDLLSVTVVGENGLLCDALSTALFVMGSERAAAYLGGQNEAEAILICEDGRILATGGLRERFQPLGEYAGCEMVWIEEA